jgi:hypothetical protein
MTKFKLLCVLSVLVLVGLLSACGDDDVLFFGTGSAVFVNTDYVSATQTDNLIAALEAQGEKVTTFTGITADEIAKALRGKAYLVIPEQDVDPIELDADAQARVRAFVRSGGKIIHLGSWLGYYDFLNDTFGLALESGVDETGYSSDLDTAAADHTAFAGGPSSIDGNDGTYALVTGSLPTGAKSIYSVDADNTTVAVIKQGLGTITFLGWDWYKGAPNGPQDGGWLSVLKSAYGIKP